MKKFLLIAASALISLGVAFAQVTPVTRQVNGRQVNGSLFVGAGRANLIVNQARKNGITLDRERVAHAVWGTSLGGVLKNYEIVYGIDKACDRGRQILKKLNESRDGFVSPDYLVSDELLEKVSEKSRCEEIFCFTDILGKALFVNGGGGRGCQYFDGGACCESTGDCFMY